MQLIRALPVETLTPPHIILPKILIFAQSPLHCRSVYANPGSVYLYSPFGLVWGKTHPYGYCVLPDAKK